MRSGSGECKRSRNARGRRGLPSADPQMINLITLVEYIGTPHLIILKMILKQRLMAYPRDGIERGFPISVLLHGGIPDPSARAVPAKTQAQVLRITCGAPTTRHNRSRHKVTRASLCNIGMKCGSWAKIPTKDANRTKDFRSAPGCQDAVHRGCA